MKPRLKKIAGIWFCCADGSHATPTFPERVIGLGFSPCQAWADWADLWRAALRRTA